MKKFHHKKDLPVEESPLTLQLHRRHTVVESDKDKTVATKLKPVSRSNSTSSIYKPPGANSRKGYLESTLSSSGASSASTVVITECQLSSSWLYNNKKAQMSSPKQTQSSQQASEDEEAKSPIVSRSKEKSVSSPTRRPKRCSSCCCYAAIVILASLAVVGIISAIGAIIYMEFFTETNKTQEQPLIKQSEDFSYSKKFGQSLDVRGKHQDSIFEQENSAPSSESKQELEVLNSFRGSSRNIVGKGSGNILRVKKAKEVVPVTEVDSNRGNNEAQHNKDSSDNQANAKSNSPYSKLFELYKDIHDNLIKIPSFLEETYSTDVDKINLKVPISLKETSHSEVDKITPKRSDSEEFSDLIDDKNTKSSDSAEVSDLIYHKNPKSSGSAEVSDLINNKNTRSSLSEDVSDLVDGKSSEHGYHDQIENNKQLRTLDVSFESIDSSNESPKQDLDLESSHTRKELEQPTIPKYFFRRPTEEPSLAPKNKLDMNDGINTMDNSDVQQGAKDFPKSDADLSEDSKDNSNNEHDTDLVPDWNTKNIPIGEVSMPAIPRNFFQMPSKDGDPAFRNMFSANEEVENDHSSEQSFPRFLPHIPELSEQNGDDDTASNIDADDKLPQEFNQPVSGIAVPGTFDLLRRFSIGTETDNKNNRNNEMDQHDRRFFLVQALERLRTLDVRNILPSSRQKKNSKKSPKPKLEPKVQSEQEVVTERSTYLQKLRHRFFDQ